MPRDIRSYFQPGKVNNSSSSTKASKRRIITSDDEDEAAAHQSPLKRSKKTSAKKVIDANSEDVLKKKTVSPSDIFGKKPVVREEAPKVPEKVTKKESEAHKDDDFEATLVQLDTSDIEQKYLEETNEDLRVAKAQGSPASQRRPSTTEKKKTPTKSTRETNGSTGDAKNAAKKSAKRQDKKSPESPRIQIEPPERKKPSPKEPDVYDELVEKKKQHSIMYQQYLNRGGARNPGSKEIPDGAENCLSGLSFVVTGVLDSLEREEAEELIKKYGGRVAHQVSKKTSYVILGDQPGPAKVEKARNFNVSLISEDDLLELIRTRPAGQACDGQKPRARSGSQKRGNKSVDFEESTSKKARRENEEKMDEDQREDEAVRSGVKRNDESNKRRKEKEDLRSGSTEKPVDQEICIQTKNEENKWKRRENEEEKSPETKPEIKSNPEVNKSMRSESEAQKSNPEHQKAQLLRSEPKPPKTLREPEIIETPVQALAEKYRPKTMKQLLGQQGDKSNAKKLHAWLSNWYKNQTSKIKKTRPSPFAKNDDGSFFKAALLSGPPGIGKTTTVQVVCKELGFDLVEFNASDTRSKRLLKEDVSGLLSNKTLKNYFEDNKKPTRNHVLLMDEVDGMAGNEDRGGLQELIALIKSSDIPIVCICNDRNHQKMRTLSNYTFDLKFAKPRLEQIRGAMKSICFKENIKISNEDLDRLIEATNQDIRQVINHLSLFVNQTGTQEKSERKHANKDLKLGPWDVVRKVFSSEEHKHMNIHDKSDLFFHDYSLSPLFVQENYLSVTPHVPKREILERVADAAESIALGDLVDKSIRSNNAWSLLPTQACFSSVIPGSLMSGHMSGQINFPAWLGKNSRAGKFNRLIQEITQHARLATGVSKEAINLDYLKPLRDKILRPLAKSDEKEDVMAAVEVMNTYHLLREDLDGLIEISLWPGDRDPMQFVDSKVKAAFTRAYNKSSVLLPYSVTTTVKKKAARSPEDVEDLGEGDEEEVADSGEDEDNVETDLMIKAKKPKKEQSKPAEETKNAKSRSKASGSKPKRGKGR